MNNSLKPIFIGTIGIPFAPTVQVIDIIQSLIIYEEFMNQWRTTSSLSLLE